MPPLWVHQGTMAPGLDDTTPCIFWEVVVTPGLEPGTEWN